MTDFDSMQKFVKRWRALEAQKRDLDRALAEYARDLIAEFGNAGEKRASKWCVDHLGLTQIEADELMARGRAIALVPEARDWTALGGFTQIRALDDLPTKRERVDAIGAAKAESKRIRTVVRERLAVGQPAVNRAPTPREDAAALARFVASRFPEKNIPLTIREVVQRYVANTAVAKVA